MSHIYLLCWFWAEIWWIKIELLCWDSTGRLLHHPCQSAAAAVFRNPWPRDADTPRASCHGAQTCRQGCLADRAGLPGCQYQMSDTREANENALWATEKMADEHTKDVVTFCFTEIIEGPDSLLVTNKGDKTPVAALLSRFDLDCFFPLNSCFFSMFVLNFKAPYSQHVDFGRREESHAFQAWRSALPRLRHSERHFIKSECQFFYILCSEINGCLIAPWGPAPGQRDWGRGGVPPDFLQRASGCGRRADLFCRRSTCALSAKPPMSDDEFWVFKVLSFGSLLQWLGIAGRLGLLVGRLCQTVWPDSFARMPSRRKASKNAITDLNAVKVSLLALKVSLLAVKVSLLAKSNSSLKQSIQWWWACSPRSLKSIGFKPPYVSQFSHP